MPNKKSLLVLLGAVLVEWLSSRLAEQGLQVLIPGLAAGISEIGYLPLPVLI